MHRKKLYYFLRIVTLCSLFSGASLYTKYELFNDSDNPIVPIVDTQGMGWRDDWHYITYLFINEANNQLCFRTYPFTTINTSGFYKLASNVANQITIAVSNVTLDMNGCTVSGGANGIVVTGGLLNVTIRNGTVNGGNDGILVNAGCTDITLKEITAKNCLRGITFDYVHNGIISNCDLVLNTTGLHIDSSHNVFVENCTAHANKQAGFSLITSTTCAFTDCEAIATGKDNENLFGDTSNVFGFVSSNGYGNIFERCIANSTQALTTTASDSIVAGFGLRGTESCSKIIASEAGNAITSSNGLTIPYGIWLEQRFDGLVTVTSENPNAGSITDQVRSVAWSPDGMYVAAGGVFGSVFILPDLILYRFDRILQRFIEVDRFNTVTGMHRFVLSGIFSVRWSPDGQYLAVGGRLNVPGDSLAIFRFDQSDEFLTQIISMPIDGTPFNTVISVDWSPDGQYLAVGGQ